MAVRALRFSGDCPQAGVGSEWPLIKRRQRPGLISPSCEPPASARHRRPTPARSFAMFRVCWPSTMARLPACNPRDRNPAPRTRAMAQRSRGTARPASPPWWSSPPGGTPPNRSAEAIRAACTAPAIATECAAIGWIFLATSSRRHRPRPRDGRARARGRAQGVGRALATRALIQPRVFSDRNTRDPSRHVTRETSPTPGAAN